MKNIILIDNVAANNFASLIETLDADNNYLLRLPNIGNSEWAYCGDDFLDFVEKIVASCGLYVYISKESINVIETIKKVWKLPEAVEVASRPLQNAYFQGIEIFLDGCPCSFYGKYPRESSFFSLVLPLHLVTPDINVVPRDLSPEEILNNL